MPGSPRVSTGWWTSCSPSDSPKANDRRRGHVIRTVFLAEETAMPERKRQKRRGAAPQPERTPGPHHVADEPVGEADALNATVRSVG